MKNFVVKTLATFFGIGYFPVGPGSLASAAGALIYFYLHDQTLLYVGLFVVITILGFWASGPMEKLIDSKDPSCVVIDEVSGVMISFFMLPLSWPVFIVAFFLFRAFDMFKLYPVNKFEDLHGGVGIMMDDVIAGIYTNIVMHLALRFAGVM